MMSPQPGKLHWRWVCRRAISGSFVTMRRSRPGSGMNSRPSQIASVRVIASMCNCQPTVRAWLKPQAVSVSMPGYRLTASQSPIASLRPGCARSPTEPTSWWCSSTWVGPWRQVRSPLVVESSVATLSRMPGRTRHAQHRLRQRSPAPMVWWKFSAPQECQRQIWQSCALPGQDSPVGRTRAAAAGRPGQSPIV